MIATAIAIAVASAAYSVEQGRELAGKQQRILGEQIARQLERHIARTESFIVDLNLKSNSAELEDSLASELLRRQSEGWLGISVQEPDGRSIARVGIGDHDHVGQEGLTVCEKCTDRKHLVFRGENESLPVEVVLDLAVLQREIFGGLDSDTFVGRVQLFVGNREALSIGARHIDDDDKVLSDVALRINPALRVSIAQPRQSLTRNLHNAVYLQALAAIAFVLALALLLFMVRRLQARETKRLQESAAERERMHLRTAHLDRLSTMGLMAASVAHELSSPLTYVMACLDFAKMKAEADNDSELLEDLGNGTEGCNRICTLLADMKMMAHPIGGKDKPVALRDVIETATRIARAKVRSIADIDVQLPHLPMVIGNQSRLGQVFLNLLNNAGDALEDAPKPAEGRHWIRIRGEVNETNHTIEISVEDSGSGIPEKLRNEIFDSFFTTKEVGKGTGLGLAICKEIMSEHKGDLRLVDSGGGARFIISMPIATPRASKLPANANENENESESEGEAVSQAV